MKNIRLLLFSALAGLSFLATSCGDKLSDTDHPDKGNLSIITSWGTGITATTPYIINYRLEDSEDSKVVEANSIVHDIKLLAPGKYNLDIYSKDFNTGFTVDGDVIEVDLDSENPDPAFIYANPAVFFSSRTTTTVRADKVNKITVPMYPQMRKLVIRIYLANDPVIYTWQNPGGEFRKIDKSSIVGTLSGVANRFNFIDNIYTGSKKVNLPFKEVFAKGNKQRYLESTVTLVGFNEEDIQNFSLAFDFEDGLQIPATTDEFHDLLFENPDEGTFNDYDKKRTNYVITRQIVLPMSTSGSAVIEDYDPVNGGDINVGEDTYKYSIGDAYPKNSATKEGVVIWVAEEPGTPGVGSHGIVISGAQSDTIAWGPTADIYVVDGSGNPIRDKDKLYQFTAIYSLGTKNVSGILTYINSNKGGAAGTGFLEQEFEAYAWIKGSESKFSGYWFLPSTIELQLLDGVPDLNGKLAAAGFQTLEDPKAPGTNVTLWSSQIEPVFKPQDEWLTDQPEYNPSHVLIRNPNGTIGKTVAVKPNPNYVPPVPGAPVDPTAPEPEPEFIPIRHYTRAFRFF